MTAPWRPPAPGVLDDSRWPEKLRARAVQPGDSDDRLHGFAVLGDLARHYRHSDVLYLAIVGELPDTRSSALFHVALCSFATLSVNEAPSHIGVLSRICGGTLASALGAGLVAVADHARHMLDVHGSLLAWLASPTGTFPPEFASTVPDEWTRSLRDVEPSTLLKPEMTRDAARIVLLHEAGLRSRDQIEAAIVAAHTCGLLAEVLATGPHDLAYYPIKLPPFHYVDSVT